YVDARRRALIIDALERRTMRRDFGEADVRGARGAATASAAAFSDAVLSKVKLDQFRRLSTAELIASLRPGLPGALKASPRKGLTEMAAKVFGITGPWRGRLGIVPRPRGAEWLDDETRSWREAGIDVVVSLLEPAEEAEIALAGESASSAVSGLEFRSFPIPD